MAALQHLERVLGARGGTRLVRLVENYAARDPVRATLKGLVHHGRHARSKFVAHHLRDQVREERAELINHAHTSKVSADKCAFVLVPNVELPVCSEHPARRTYFFLLDFTFYMRANLLGTALTFN